ncbi:MAG: methylaspartate mutase subunit E, partial [Bacillota bacterium]|nr:methylaspartate mutase subunit E [Bacillota bacterium]
MDLQNKKIADSEFFALRKEVLMQWPTGKDVDLQEASDYHKALPEEKIFSKKLTKAKNEHKTLIQPRAGVPVIEEHIKLLRYLQDNGEADLLPTTIDSYTRQNRYEEAENGINESIRLNRAMLNGFPAVNHGVKGCRRIIDSLSVPVQVRHGTPDARLLTEIALAGGFTSYEGGGISYNLPYCKNVPLERTIRDWQYVDRLSGLYEEMGVSINREPYGPLTGTLVPPCISHATAIIEALLAAEQGVKNITVGYGQCGNLVQDIAAIRTLEELTEEYLRDYGYGDVTVTSVLHQWMGGFPADEAKAFGVISLGSMIAALSKATKVIVKSPQEAVGIPTMEANAQGMRCTKQVVNMLLDQVFKNSELEQEKEVIRRETRCIVDKCFELGDGDIAVGVCRGVEAGVLDVPFAPCRVNAGLMLPVRDNGGAVRILNTGKLPFPQDIKDFHKEKIEERARAEKR